jgi:hypothetical protein
VRRSFHTAVPVTAKPQPPEVRAAIAEIVRDLHPTEVTNFKVDRIAPDRAVITADVPAKVGHQIVREVYFDHAGV